MNHHAQLVRLSDFRSYTHTESAASVISSVTDSFGISEARALSSEAQLRPHSDGGQVFIIQTGFVTHEAQNALLKLFEEPPADTSFVLVVPPALQLLPTLRSRFGSDVQVAVGEIDTRVWDSFYASSPTERLKQIAQWQKTKDPVWLQSIALGVHSIRGADFSAEVLTVVQQVGSKLQTRGASNKMLLEHLALALPFQK